MKSYYVIITISIIILYSCHASKKSQKIYKKGAVLEHIEIPSKDTTNTSLLIKAIDIDTREIIPYCYVWKDGEYKDWSVIMKTRNYSADSTGLILINDFKEGICNINISFVGYHTLHVENLRISKSFDTHLLVGLKLTHL